MNNLILKMGKRPGHLTKKIHTKKSWTLDVIRELQIKTTIRYQYTLNRMAKIQTQTILHADENKQLSSPLVGMQKYIAILWGSLAVSAQKTNSSSYYIIQQSDSSAFTQMNWILMLTQNLHQETWTGKFIAALLITAKIWKQSRDPSVGEWINCVTSRQWKIVWH